MSLNLDGYWVEKLDWDAFQSGPEGILVSVMSGKETYLMGYTPS
jgi:hypothetical protein